MDYQVWWHHLCLYYVNVHSPKVLCGLIVLLHYSKLFSTICYVLCPYSSCITYNTVWLSESNDDYHNANFTNLKTKASHITLNCGDSMSKIIWRMQWHMNYPAHNCLKKQALTILTNFCFLGSTGPTTDIRCKLLLSLNSLHNSLKWHNNHLLNIP